MLNLKILILTPQLKIGGTERHIQRLSLAIKKNGFIPIIICIQTDDFLSPIHQDLQDSGITVHFFKLSVLNIGNFIRLIQLIKREKIQVIHSFFYGNVIWDSILYLLSGANSFVTERRNIQHWRINSNIGLFEHLRNFLTTKIVANSNQVKKIAILIEGIQKNKIRVIYNGIDKINHITIAQRNLAKSKIGFKSKDFVAINIANLKKIKNQEEIIYAMNLFCKQNPAANFFLLLIGRPDNEYEAKLKDLCKELHLDNKVFFIGEEASVKNFLFAADVFILSSLFEGFSNSVLEALSYGIPVISSNVGGISEIIKPNNNGFLYKSGNIKMLVKLIEKVYKNSDLRSQLSKSALISAANHNIDKVAKEYLEIYRFNI